MKPQPDRIVFATERPLQIATLRELLDCSGLAAELSVLMPLSLGQNLIPGEACLVILDGEARQPWDEIARARRQGANSRFVLLSAEVTPQLIHTALVAGVHGVLSTSLPLDEVCRALSLVWQGQSQFRYGVECSADRAREEQKVSFPVSMAAGKLARREARAW